MAQRVTSRRPRSHLALLCAILCVTLLTPALSVAEPISEREAVLRGLEGNRNLSAARLRVQSAEAGIDEAEGLFPWLLNANAEYAHRDTPIRDTFSSGVQIRDSFNLSLSLSKIWPFGTELTIAFTNFFLRSEQPVSFELGGNVVEDRRIIGPFANTVLLARVTQHLLRGGDYDRNRIPERAARHQKSLSELNLEQQSSAALLDVLNAYWDLRLAEAELSLRRSSVERLEEQREVTRALIDAGLIAEIELGVVDQQRLNAEEAVLLSELARQQRGLTLRRLLGEDLRAPDPLVANEPIDRPIPPLDRERLLTAARERSVALRQIRERVALQRLEVERLEDELLPTLDLTLELAQQGVDDALGPEDALFFNAWGQVALLQAGAVTFGVLFSTPLDFDRGEAQVSGASYELSALDLELAEAQAQSDEQVLSLIEGIEQGQRRLELLDRSVVLAERNLASGNERFRAGLLTNLDVGRLQEELEAARIQRAAVRIELTRQRLALDHATGGLLERFEVVITEDGVESQRTP